jgi:toxin-antitoxin system PIN domain toxin
MVVKAGYLLDVNVLIAMAWPPHPDHVRVHKWLSHHAHEGWATCPLTQTGFVRIVSNPVFSTNAPGPDDALSLLRANLGHPAHTFWTDEISFTSALERLSLRLKGHQQVSDAYLLGLAMHKGGKLATMDRAISDLVSEKQSSREFVELV